MTLGLCLASHPDCASDHRPMRYASPAPTMPHRNCYFPLRMDSMQSYPYPGRPGHMRFPRIHRRQRETDASGSWRTYPNCQRSPNRHCCYCYNCCCNYCYSRNWNYCLNAAAFLMAALLCSGRPLMWWPVQWHRYSSLSLEPLPHPPIAMLDWVRYICICWIACTPLGDANRMLVSKQGLRHR